MISDGLENEGEGERSEWIHGCSSGVHEQTVLSHAVDAASCEPVSAPAFHDPSACNLAQPTTSARDQSVGIPTMRPFNILVTLLAAHGHSFGNPINNDLQRQPGCVGEPTWSQDSHQGEDARESHAGSLTDSRSGSTRSEVRGTSLQQSAHPGGIRKGVSEWVEPAWAMDPLQEVRTQADVHAESRKAWLAPCPRTSTSGHHGGCEGRTSRCGRGPPPGQGDRMGSRGEECRNLPQAGSCTTSGGCGQISRCSAEGQPKEHLLNSERLPRQSWRETYNGDSNKSSQCGGFGSRGTGLYPGKEGGTTSSSSRRSSRIHKPGVKFVEPKDTILENPVESKDMIIENPVESEDMIIENPVESEDMIIENLVLLEDEASIEEKARCLFQAQDFSMDAMENLTSLLVPAIKPSTRSFSRLKGKDSIMLHLGMFSHGNMEGVMKKTWRFPWLTRYANMWMRRQPGMGEASWTSIATSVNVEARPHRDLHNFRRQPQLPGDLRESTTWRRKGPGGQHMTGHVRTTWHQTQAFDPKSWHATMRWTGRRVALAAYTTRLIERAQPFVVKDLKEFEFPVPPKGRGIAGLFCAPDEIEGEYKVMAAEEKEEIMATLEDYEALINESGEDSPEMMNRVVELGSPGESMLKEHLEKAGVEVTSVSFKEGCDLTTLAGTERTVQMLDVVRPHWLVCYLPRGPRYEPDDPRGEHARLKLRKAARNFLKASREALDKGSQVLWTHPESQKLEAFPEVRAFWKSHQDHHGGQAVRCGAMWMRCSSSTLAEAVPHSASSSFLPWKALAEKLVESRMYFAEVMVTETEKQILESMDQKELQEIWTERTKSIVDSDTPRTAC